MRMISSLSVLLNRRRSLHLGQLVLVCFLYVKTMGGTASCTMVDVMLSWYK